MAVQRVIKKGVYTEAQAAVIAKMEATLDMTYAELSRAALTEYATVRGFDFPADMQPRGWGLNRSKD